MNAHPVLQGSFRQPGRLGLARMRSFLGFLGEPLAGIPVVHVAGTNGKSSVVQMMASVLEAAGHCAGTFTSPHLQRLNECIQVEGQEISDAELDALLRGLEEQRRRWAAALGGEGEVEVQLSFFEWMAVAAFVYLGRQGVDVALVEVGLGGRLDATNILDPLVSIINNISLDLTHRLGPDLASIASETAGIIKPGRPVVLGPLPAEALKVIRLTAAERQAPLFVSGEDFRTLGSEHGRFSYAAEALSWRDLPLGPLGQHQIDNAGVALAALGQARKRLPVTEAAARAGLERVQLPGRLEWVGEDVLLDAAHNSDGAAALARYLAGRRRERRRCLILGVGRDRDVRAIAVQLAGQVDRILTVEAPSPAAPTALAVAEKLVGIDLPVQPAASLPLALDDARDGALVVVAGSMALVGAARERLLGR